jgi:adenylate cyclase
LAQDQITPAELQQALADVDQAIKLSPRDPEMGRWHMIKGMTYNYMGRYENTVLEEQAALNSGYSTWTVYVHLAVAYAFLGRQSEAEAAAAQARKLNPKLTIKWYGSRLDAPETIHEGLRKAGVPEE